MGQSTGIVIIKANGVTYRTMSGAKLNPGGKNRKVSKGNAVFGYYEEVQESEVTCELAHQAGDDLTAYNLLTSVTLEFVCDTGQDYLITGAWVAEPAVLSAPEKVSLKFNGPPATLMG